MAFMDQILEQIGELTRLSGKLRDFLFGSDLSPHVLRKISLRAAVVQIIQDVGVLLGQHEPKGLENCGMVALARGAIALGGEEGAARLERRVVGDGETPVIGKTGNLSIGKVSPNYIKERTNLLGRRLMALKPA